VKSDKPLEVEHNSDFKNANVVNIYSDEQININIDKLPVKC